MVRTPDNQLPLAVIYGAELPEIYNGGGESEMILQMPSRSGAHWSNPSDESSVSRIEHTQNHVNCPACQAADEALLGVNTDFSKLTFKAAGKKWMLIRKQSLSLKDRTHEATQVYLHALGKFFDPIRLEDISAGQLRTYQLARTNNLIRVEGVDIHPWDGPASNSTVNHELSVVGQMLKHCKLWGAVRPYYFPLKVNSWSPRIVLTEEQEEKLWKSASRHDECDLAYWVATITNNTTASGIELRGLRLRHVRLNDNISEIEIPPEAVKNTSRPRNIPLNPTARWAMEECYKRALKLGSTEPDHFLFPKRIGHKTYDPTQQASRSWLRKNWDKLRKLTGLHHIKPHDLRHQCITRMLESNVEPETVRSIAGHVTEKMMQYYSHHRKRVKYAALLNIEPSYGVSGSSTPRNGTFASK